MRMACCSVGERPGCPEACLQAAGIHSGAPEGRAAESFSGDPGQPAAGRGLEHECCQALSSHLSQGKPALAIVVGTIHLVASWLMDKQRLAESFTLKCSGCHGQWKKCHFEYSARLSCLVHGSCTSSTEWLDIDLSFILVSAGCCLGFARTRCS